VHPWQRVWGWRGECAGSACCDASWLPVINASPQTQDSRPADVQVSFPRHGRVHGLDHNPRRPGEECRQAAESYSARSVTRSGGRSRHQRALLGRLCQLVHGTCVLRTRTNLMCTALQRMHCHITDVRTALACCVLCTPGGRSLPCLTHIMSSRHAGCLLDSTPTHSGGCHLYMDRCADVHRAVPC
jgi:hypothetical protein